MPVYVICLCVLVWFICMCVRLCVCVPNMQDLESVIFHELQQQTRLIQQWVFMVGSLFHYSAFFLGGEAAKGGLSSQTSKSYK